MFGNPYDPNGNRDPYMERMLDPAKDPWLNRDGTLKPVKMEDAPVPTPLELQKTKPKRLAAKRQKHPPAKWNEPGCCDISNCVVYWNGQCWVHLPDSGGAVQCEIQVHYCPFCGTKLTDETPAKK